MPGGRRFIVIDPGSADPSENARLLAVVERRVAAGGAVEAVVLSHHHRDHVAGAGPIASALGVPVLAHAETLARIPALPSGIATRALRDGDRLDLDGSTLEVVHTPGHAPGHLAFFHRARRALFACDLVSGVSTILVGGDGGDMDLYLDALHRAAELDPKVVLPSHGPPLPGRALQATIAHREKREAAVIDALAGGAAATLAAIAAAAYADTPQALPFLSELQTRAHLDRLTRSGRVEHAAGAYRLRGR
jgi:glyoxylase-like metal-dependent hydrolase (beta-lactamase superfamily II)